MDELCQDLRREGQPVTGSEQTRQQGAGGGVVDVLDNFERDEKTGVDAVRHARPSNISSSRSSSGESDRSTFPTLTGAISSTLRPAGKGATTGPCAHQAWSWMEW